MTAADTAIEIKPAEVAAALRRPCRRITLITYAVSTLAVLAVGVALHYARPLILPIIFALIISTLLRPAAAWFDRQRIPETISATFLSLLVVLTLFGAAYFAGRPAIAWFDRLPAVMVDARQKLDGLERAIRRVSEVTKKVEEIADAPEENEPPEVQLRESSIARSITASAQSIIIQFLLTTVLIYFFLSTRRSSRRKILALRGSLRTRLRSGRILSKVEDNVVRYMLTMLAINAGLGLSVGVAIALLGGSSPVVFGALAGVLNFIPYLGPAVLNILLGVTGLVQEDNLLMALAPVGAYTALNFIESNFVTPSLIGAQSRISPLAIILAIAFFAWLWGPAGAVVAIPILIVIKTVCDSVSALRPIGILLSERVQADRAPSTRKFGLAKLQAS